MTHVIKRGGRRQSFSPSKIKNSIKKATREAGFSPSKTQKLVKDVGEAVIAFFRKKRVVKTTDIRKSILRRLSTKAKSVIPSWKRHERKKRKKCKC